jgi:hypothetical protein
MDARKLQVKLYLASPTGLDVAPLVPVFHEWIQKNALGELLVDVTEYGHVHESPALLLVGHESDYAIDFGEGRAGLVCNRKRGGPADAIDNIVDALRRTLGAARRLESETSVPAPLRFGSDEILIQVNDRLRAPNTPATFAAIKPVFEAAFRKLFAATAFTLEPTGSPRELLGVRVKAPGAPSIAELLSRIA